jgi:hypothetical protein
VRAAEATRYAPELADNHGLPVLLLLLLLLQVLDLSANELSETGVCVLAEATRNAPGLRQLRLLGNKIPFGLSTLRKLMEVSADVWHVASYMVLACS